MIKIAPSILTADFGRLAEELAAAEEGGADWIHLDVMDGRFVPNISFGPIVARAARAASGLPIDAHLMIEDPDRYLAAFADAGVDSITVHVEACPHLHRTVQTIRGLGLRAGVALNPATPTDWIEDIVGDVDLILVMSVNPGFGGQRFIPRSLDRIRRISDLLAEREPGLIDLQVDGGVGRDTIGAVTLAGATVVVAGSAVFDGKSAAGENLRALRDAAARKDSSP